MIQDKEIDFIVGKYAIEINGHKQNTDKNEMLVSAGYIPIHFSNDDTLDKNNLINILKQCQN